MGVLAALGVSVCSGFASVYLEKILKGDKTPLLVRNVQLCIFSIPLQLFAIYQRDYSQVLANGWLHGFCLSTRLVITLQSPPQSPPNHPPITAPFSVSPARQGPRHRAVEVSILLEGCIQAQIAPGARGGDAGAGGARLLCGRSRLPPAQGLLARLEAKGVCPLLRPKVASRRKVRQLDAVRPRL